MSLFLNSTCLNFRDLFTEKVKSNLFSTLPGKKDKKDLSADSFVQNEETKFNFDEKDLNKKIADLDSNKFDTREKATISIPKIFSATDLTLSDRVEIIKRLKKGKEISLEAAKRIEVIFEGLDKLINTKDYAKLYIELSEKKILPGEMSVPSKASAKIAILFNEKTPTENAKKILEFETNYVIKAIIAGSKETPVRLLEILAEDKSDRNDSIKRILSENPNTPKELRKKLIEEIPPIAGRIVLQWPPKEKLAGDPKTPSAQLVELSKDSSENVRYEVAKNPNTPIDTRLRLAEDEKAWVRGAVGQSLNPNDPKNSKDLNIEILRVLDKLAEDKDPIVRRGVIRNPNIPDKILKNLLNDEDEVKANYVGNPKVPAEVLKQYSKHKESYIRANVAMHKNTTLDTLDEMLNNDEKDPHIEWYVVENLIKKLVPEKK